MYHPPGLSGAPVLGHPEVDRDPLTLAAHLDLLTPAAHLDLLTLAAHHQEVLTQLAMVRLRIDLPHQPRREEALTQETQDLAILSHSQTVSLAVLVPSLQQLS